MLDRKLQRLILEKASKEHPDWLAAQEVRECFLELYPTALDYDENVIFHPDRLFFNERLKLLLSTLDYLTQRKLIVVDVSDYDEVVDNVRITADGLDFLEDDGGLAAILNTVTIKFDSDNLRKLIEAGIIKSELPNEQKNNLRAKLQELPATALEKLTGKMLDAFLDDPSKAITIIAKTVGLTL